MRSAQSDVFNHYPGGKNVNGVYQTIINLIPPHKVYIEPFLGGGTILRKKLPADLTVGNDLDGHVFNQWRDYPLEGFELHNQPALQLLSAMRPGKESFVYADPPYPKASIKSNLDIYSCTMSLEDHEHFLFWAITTSSNCMISTYPNELYESMLCQWNKIEFKSATHAGSATEIVYMNYSFPKELHDYQYLGKNCWDRQRIKRKIQRRIDTLSKLPLLEQKAIINGLNEKLVDPTVKNDFKDHTVTID